MLRQALGRLFDTFGMTAPEGSRFGKDIGGLYDYLEVCLKVLCLGSRLWGKLSAKKALHVLAHSFCSLIPPGCRSPARSCLVRTFGR